MAKQSLSMSNGNFKSKIKSDFLKIILKKDLMLLIINVNHLALDTVSNTTFQQIC